MVIWTSVVEDSDAAIIWQSRLEPECFAAIFDRYYIQIHGYAARRLGHSLADDVAAETFLIAFERRDRYDVSWLNARPWLYGITSNLICGHHRAEERRYRALSRVSADEVGDEYADQVAQRVGAPGAPCPAGGGPGRDRRRRPGRAAGRLRGPES